MTSDPPDPRIISLPGERRSLTDMHVGCMQLAYDFGPVGLHGCITNPRDRMQKVGEHFQYSKRTNERYALAGWEKEKPKHKSLTSVSLKYFGSTFHLSNTVILPN